MSLDYDVKNWYWIVAGDASKVYSSKLGDYVQVSDATYQAWLSGGNLPTNILSADELAEVLALASVRPAQADLLDRYRGSQASKLTIELVAKVLFNHENRIRVLESKQSVTAGQFAAALKAML